jgi:Carboxypeptidase regulatory-like domain
MKQILGWSLLFVSVACLAQGTTSRISGVATDASGAVVSGAVITATNEDTGVSYSTKTSASGTYSFESLQIGRYTLRAEASGFRQFVSTGNVLAIGVPTSIDPKFRVGETTVSRSKVDMIWSRPSHPATSARSSTTLR